MLQLALPVPHLSRRGGARPGAGRPKVRGSGVPHVTRAPLAARHPVHVTMKLLPIVPTLRTRAIRAVLEGAFASGKERFGFRLVHYSIQQDHIHIVAEAEDARALGRGLKGLAVRIARRLNRHLGRKDAVFADRYHAHVLKTPREVHHALDCVLNNATKHAARIGAGVTPAGVDPYSSGPWFDGWRRPPLRIVPVASRSTVAEARTWLLATGWRRHGLLVPRVP